MDLKQAVQTQREFDAAHEWTAKDGTTEEVLRLVRDDIVGLVAELGEFANVVKKLSLLSERKTDRLEEAFAQAKGGLSEELIDTFIYVLRIAGHLGVDLEEQYREKLTVNRERYHEYEKP